jgi:colicin import membrane protein
MTDDEFLLHCVSEIAKAVSLRIEQEAARKAAEDIEIARLAEIKRQSDEIRIRQAELDSERKAMAAEREAMQHQQQIERRALEEQQAEVRRQQQEIQREADRKTEAERQRVLAERKAEDDRLAVIAAEQKEVARQARLEALKPEIEKAEMFANRLAEMSAAVLVSMEKPVWGPSAMMIIRQAGIDVIKIARGEG